MREFFLRLHEDLGVPDKEIARILRLLCSRHCSEVERAPPAEWFTRVFKHKMANSLQPARLHSANSNPGIVWCRVNSEKNPNEIKDTLTSSSSEDVEA